MSKSEKFIEYKNLLKKLIELQTKIRDGKKEYFDRTNLNNTFQDRNKTEEWAKKNLESLEKEIKYTSEKSNEILSSFTDEELKKFKEEL